MFKLCSSCHFPKERIDFYRVSAAKDGHQSQCKTCISARADPEKARARYKRYNLKRPKYSNQKRRTPSSPTYGKEYRARPTVRARRKLAKKVYRQTEHGRKKTSTWRRIRYQQNHTHSLAIAALYRKRCPEKFQEFRQRRRARIKGAPINDLTGKQWQMIQELFQHRCAYCGRKMTKLTPDHVTPYAKNGSNTLWNVVPACSSCNSKKGARAPLIPVQPLLLVPA